VLKTSATGAGLPSRTLELINYARVARVRVVRVVTPTPGLLCSRTLKESQSNPVVFPVQIRSFLYCYGSAKDSRTSFESVTGAGLPSRTLELINYARVARVRVVRVVTPTPGLLCSRTLKESQSNPVVFPVQSQKLFFL
jgi:hypothetical protein